MINTHIVHGRLTADPELRATPKGKSVCNFDIASNHSFKDSEGKEVEEVFFGKIVAWGGAAEVIAKHFTKGKEIILQGRPKTRTYESKEGETRYVQEITLESFDFCGSRVAGEAPDREEVASSARA